MKGENYGKVEYYFTHCRCCYSRRRFSYEKIKIVKLTKYLQ